jgi:hypothetical protein
MTTEFTNFMLCQITALAASRYLIQCGRQLLSKLFAARLIPLQKVIDHSLRRFRPNTGETAKSLDQLIY